MKSFPTPRSVTAALNAEGSRYAAQMQAYINAFCRQSTKDGYNTTEAKNDALTDLMAARTAENDELVDDLTYFEIEDASMSYANAIIVMILFGLIGTDVIEKNLESHYDHAVLNIAKSEFHAYDRPNARRHKQIKARPYC